MIIVRAFSISIFSLAVLLYAQAASAQSCQINDDCPPPEPDRGQCILPAGSDICTNVGERKLYERIYYCSRRNVCADDVEVMGAEPCEIYTDGLECSDQISYTCSYRNSCAQGAARYRVRYQANCSAGRCSSSQEISRVADGRCTRNTDSNYCRTPDGRAGQCFSGRCYFELP